MAECSQATIIIPAYNEERSVGAVVEGLEALYRDVEVIVVDDGSTDDTGRRARQAGATVIRHRHNRGYGAALKTGLRHAQRGVVVLFDADGQHDPRDIARLVEPIGEYDMVIGARTKDSHAPLARRLGKKVLTMVAEYLTGTKIPDLNSGLRALKREAVLPFLPLFPNGFSFSTTLSLVALKTDWEVGYRPIVTYKRVGKSYVGLSDAFRTLLLIIRMVTLFNPLKTFLPIAGVLFFLGGVELVAELILYRNIGQVALLGLISGLLMFVLGIQADHLSTLLLNRGRD